MQTNVVNLGQVRDLLSQWERVREAIKGGRVTGFQLSVLDDQEREAIYLGGVYKEDPQLALRTALKMSTARVLAEDEPPLLAKL